MAILCLSLEAWLQKVVVSTREARSARKITSRASLFFCSCDAGSLQGKLHKDLPTQVLTVTEGSWKSMSWWHFDLKALVSRYPDNHTYADTFQFSLHQDCPTESFRFTLWGCLSYLWAHFRSLLLLLCVTNCWPRSGQCRQCLCSFCCSLPWCLMLPPPSCQWYI